MDLSTSECMDHDLLPRGSWIQTARHIQVVNDSSKKPLLMCELLDMQGRYHPQTISFDPDDILMNINGFFLRYHNSFSTSFPSHSLSIPSHIFQTHRSWKYVQHKIMLRKATRTWTSYRSAFHYHFFNDLECRQFIEQYFDSTVLQAYDRCPISVMKADLWRYCILYVHGGIYSDVDTLLKCHPSVFTEPRTSLVVSLEQGTNLFCQWTFAAPPQSFILKYIIDLSVSRILNIPHITGEHIIHYLTGPGVFTDGIELALQSVGMSVCPEHREIFYPHYQNNILHVLPPRQFHSEMILHLFMGDIGWKRERDRQLKS